MPAKYPLIGGLDLTTVKPLAKPGTLRDCLNFEVSTLSGYSRISGIARYDGSEAVGGYKVWRLKHTGNPVFAAGDNVYFDPTLMCRVLSVEVVSGVTVCYVLVPGKHINPQLPANLTKQGGSPVVSIVNREAVFSGYGTQDNFDSGLAMIEADQIARISSVPGRPGSDVIGGFFFKDRLYVIRDLPHIGFQGGYYTDADEGRYVTIDGQEYKVLDVTITGDQQGILTYDTSPGTGDDAAPIGSVELTTLPVTGDYGPGYTFIPYADDLDVSGGVAPYTWSLVGDSGLAIDPIQAPDANAINFLPQLTNAALYRSGSNGWERVDLGRELQFRNGTSAIKNFARTAVLDTTATLSTDFRYPGTGSVNHVNTTNLGADDGTDAALVPGATVEFQAYNFDFSVIPDNASIQGIEVLVERHANTANPAMDMLVNLMGIEGGTTNKARGGNWPNASTATTYGSSTDLWGSQNLTGANIKQVGFGARVIATQATPGTDMVGGVDRIQINIYYVERDTQLYVWDGTTDVVFTLHHTQITSGDAGASTAQGYMSVTGAVNHAKPRLVMEGDELRTAPNGGGNLLGLAASRDRPIWLSGQAEIDNNRSRYQFWRDNFYGQDEFETVYGVSGAGPAFSYDGTRFIRIRTELPANQDLPRHVCRHGDMLVLGFWAGAVVFSAVGDPYELRGSAGANAAEVGDRMVGLLPLAGDALGIICQTKTQVIRGTTPASMVKSPISAKRGGLEYTAVDMGRIVLCDGLGIFTADSPEQFGAASRNYISGAVHPWLAQRLQATVNTEDATLRPVAAMEVRHKNQMRIYFWDGWVLTATMNEPPEFTTQRYFTPAPDSATEPVPWIPRMLCSGIDSSGRERLFVSYFGGVKEGLVFEMDSGRSFDGAPIPAYVEMNPLTIEASSLEKRYDRLFVYGTGLCRGTLTFSRQVNDGNEFSGTQSFKLGNGSNNAKLMWAPMRGVVDSPTEGYDISIRFDSNSATEGVFALQYAEMDVDSRGNSRGRQGDHR